MGDADDLLVLTEGFELIGNGGEHESADAGVDLVEDEGFDAAGAAEDGFDGEHDAAHFPAGGDVVKRTQRHARVWRDHEQTGVGAGGVAGETLELYVEAHGFHGHVSELCDEALAERFPESKAALVELFGEGGVFSAIVGVGFAKISDVGIHVGEVVDLFFPFSERVDEAVDVHLIFAAQLGELCETRVHGFKGGWIKIDAFAIMLKIAGGIVDDDAHAFEIAHIGFNLLVVLGDGFETLKGVGEHFVDAALGVVERAGGGVGGIVEILRMGSLLVALGELFFLAFFELEGREFFDAFLEGAELLLKLGLLAQSALEGAAALLRLSVSGDDLRAQILMGSVAHGVQQRETRGGIAELVVIVLAVDTDELGADGFELAQGDDLTIDATDIFAI